MNQPQDIINDLLIAEKNLCSIYSTAVTEASTPNVRENLKSVLTCELDIQNQVFKTMEQKGWYQTEQAERTKINEAMNKFTNQAQ